MRISSLFLKTGVSLWFDRVSVDQAHQKWNQFRFSIEQQFRRDLVFSRWESRVKHLNTEKIDMDTSNDEPKEYSSEDFDEDTKEDPEEDLEEDTAC